MRLTSYEIGMLRALAQGDASVINPAHRIRLELLGLTKETPSGLSLTPLGADALHLEPSIKHETYEPPERRLDASGRKRAADRNLSRVS